MKETYEIISALSDEVKAVKQKYRQHPIWVEHLKLSNVSGEYFYEGIVSSLEEGDMLSIPEGVKVKIIFKEFNHIQRQWEEISRDGKLLYYDSARHHIVLQITGPSIDFTDKNRSYNIQPTVEDLLMTLQQCLRENNFYQTSLGGQIIANRFFSSLYQYPVSQYITSLLNQSQVDSVKKIFHNNISFLWGPPGTGKTTTTAAIIHELRLLGKKVLAVSISNVAVDQIALKTINTEGYRTLEKGEIIRFGYARLQKVRDQDLLFPERDHIIRFRNEIKELEQKKADSKEPVLKAKYQNDIADKLSEIKKATVEPLLKAKTVLTTATQVCLTEEFKEINFDVVIIDEASMMSIAMVIFLSTIAKEKLIISGDYKQLQPIAVAKTPLAVKWLHKDVFELAGIAKGADHSLLAMLHMQHRMSDDICAIVNKAFYFNRLQTNIKNENRSGANYPPNPSHHIVFISQTPENGNIMQRSENHSRFNVCTSNIVLHVVNKIAKRPGNVEIGIITPYAAQAQRIKKMIQEKRAKNLNLKHSDIKVGTVHSFQGDESDIIIFDLVDTSTEGPGRLFKEKQGERLFNVAISRAKGKLIVIGDPDLFKNRGLEYEKIAEIYNFIVSNYDYS